MEEPKAEETQPWITCHLTEILLNYLKETNPGKDVIDYDSLFSGVEGFERPSDPESFLTDANNWLLFQFFEGLQCSVN